MNPFDFIVLPPLLYTIYMFARLAIDQQLMWRSYDELKEAVPEIVTELGQPVSAFNAFKWMLHPVPEYVKQDPALLELYCGVKRRLVLFNCRRLPFALLLWVVVLLLFYFLE